MASDTQRSMLIGGLTLGSQRLLTPTKGSAIPVQVTVFGENSHLTVSCKELPRRLVVLSLYFRF